MGEEHGHGHGSAGQDEHAGQGEHAGQDGPPAAPALPDPPAAAGLLTPAAVRNQVFTVVRLREGYDLAEVDQFLGQVETTLIRVLCDNADLRARAADGDGGRAGGGEDERVSGIARRAADRTLALAHQEARAILEQARRTAEQLERAAWRNASARHPRSPSVSPEALDERIQRLHTAVAASGSGLRDAIDGQISRLHTLLDELRDLTRPGQAPPSARHAAPERPTD
ncbi:DivIVA domain-containing protein [Streptosporangium sp. NPDC004379]|uniref:DivIVA domain-containing protein n=1 Tax=Streptosporangium sp. NPDC004379 TaxID=3366189 RepID=UPI0036826808